MTLDFYKYETPNYLQTGLIEYIIKSGEEIKGQFRYINSYSESIILLGSRVIYIKPVFKFFAKLSHYKIIENEITIGQIEPGWLFSKPSIGLNNKELYTYQKIKNSSFFTHFSTKGSYHIKICNIKEIIEYHFTTQFCEGMSKKVLIGKIETSTATNMLLALTGLLQIELMLMEEQNRN